MNDKYVLAVGDPWNGMDLHGVFDSHDDAVAHATVHHQGEAWIVAKLLMVPNKLERILDEEQAKPKVGWPFGQ